MAQAQLHPFLQNVFRQDSWRPPRLGGGGAGGGFPPTAVGGEDEGPWRWREVAYHYANMKQELADDPARGRARLNSWAATLPRTGPFYALSAMHCTALLLLMEDTSECLHEVSLSRYEARFPGAYQGLLEGRWAVGWELSRIEGVPAEEAWDRLFGEASKVRSSSASIEALHRLHWSWKLHAEPPQLRTDVPLGARRANERGSDARWVDAIFDGLQSDRAEFEGLRAALARELRENARSAHDRKRTEPLASHRAESLQDRLERLRAEAGPARVRWVEVAAHYARLREAIEDDPQLRRALLSLWHSRLPQVPRFESLEAEDRAKVFLLLEEIGWGRARAVESLPARFRGAREAHAVGRWRVAYHLLRAAGTRPEAAWPMLAEHALDAGASAEDLASLGRAQFDWSSPPPFERKPSGPLLPLVPFHRLPEVHQEALVALLSDARSAASLQALIGQLEEQFPGFKRRVLSAQPNAEPKYEAASLDALIGQLEEQFPGLERRVPSAQPNAQSKYEHRATPKAAWAPDPMEDHLGKLRVIWIPALSLVLWGFLFWLMTR